MCLFWCKRQQRGETEEKFHVVDLDQNSFYSNFYSTQRHLYLAYKRTDNQRTLRNTPGD